jgi:DNA-3-methyladenine glycosylase I
VAELTATTRGPDGRRRCWWAAADPDYVAYHDQEWGRPIRDDDGMFERICLELFQAGLSWLLVLRRRPALRAAFDSFRIARVADYDERDLARCLAAPGMIRNQAKLRAVVGNARAALEVPDGLAAHVWTFAPRRRRRAPRRRTDLPAQTAESAALAGDLRRRGFRFVGPTSAYATMQAAGLVDDHVAGCWRRGCAE